MLASVWLRYSHQNQQIHQPIPPQTPCALKSSHAQKHSTNISRDFFVPLLFHRLTVSKPKRHHRSISRSILAQPYHVRNMTGPTLAHPMTSVAHVPLHRREIPPTPTLKKAPFSTQLVNHQTAMHHRQCTFSPRTTRCVSEVHRPVRCRRPPFAWLSALLCPQGQSSPTALREPLLGFHNSAYTAPSGVYRSVAPLGSNFALFYRFRSTTCNSLSS